MIGSTATHWPIDPEFLKEGIRLADEQVQGFKAAIERAKACGKTKKSGNIGEGRSISSFSELCSKNLVGHANYCSPPEIANSSFGATPEYTLHQTVRMQ